MVQFKAFEEGIETSGEGVNSVIHGIHMPSLAKKILEKHKILDPKAGKWYPLQEYLDAYEEISKRFGPSALHNIGKMVPENAKWGPEVDSFEKAIESIDVAYHMNHRKDGKIMYDEKTGKMREGIGHYGCHKVCEGKLIVICNNPYPCDFDRGIIEALAKKFEPNATITHDDTKFCRKKGGESCTYIVTW